MWRWRMCLQPRGYQGGRERWKGGEGCDRSPSEPQKNQPCRHLVFCSGLQNIERMDCGCFKPLQCVVLCFVTEPQESNTGAPLSCKQRLRRWSPPRQLLGRHPPGPHHGQRWLCLLGSPPPPILCFLVNTHCRNHTGNKGQARPMCPPDLAPRAGVQPGCPAGPGVAWDKLVSRPGFCKRLCQRSSWGESGAQGAFCNLVMAGLGILALGSSPSSETVQDLHFLEFR